MLDIRLMDLYVQDLELIFQKDLFNTKNYL